MLGEATRFFAMQMFFGFVSKPRGQTMNFKEFNGALKHESGPEFRIHICSFDLQSGCQFLSLGSFLPPKRTFS